MKTANNLKNPYPNEGIIRSAQIDDTVAPENSADLAVNMNFDRVGAVQTREGVTEYADQLDDAIKNFGTLNNFTVPAGFERVVQVGQAGQFYGEAVTYVSGVKVDASHVLTFWRGNSGHGFAQVILFNAALESCTPIGNPLTFESSSDSYNFAIDMGTNHFVNLWTTTSGDAVARTFLVAPDYSVSFAGSQFTFDSGDCNYYSASVVDSGHVIVFYDEGSTGGQAVILAVNTGTWAITKPASALNFEVANATYNSCGSIGDGVHFINFWARGLCQIFAVNTGTWAITTAAATHSFDPIGALGNQCVSLGDGSHFINFWQGFKGTDIHGIVQVFEVNTGTWVISEPGTYTYFSTFTSGSGLSISAVGTGDAEHFVAGWLENGAIAEVQIFDVDSSNSYNVTAVGNPSSPGLVSSVPYIELVELTPSRIAVMWQGTTPDGEGALFRLDGNPVFHNLLYAHVDEEVENWDGTNWTVRRTGLSTTEGKARFVQYLNRIWMCNGNATIGDPIQTSDGGDFDGTLVPLGFPPVDYISAGFEGRVWGADALYGVVYYTDIVQFVPPDFYMLTYNPQVNFISQFSPQDGETITGLFEVPRALLVFTQNSIFRIYGATSIDAYAAYNVGTFSNESIVRTKTGILFHHSSGFYQFDYGCQPVEISRRIIDFVQAIPRSSYDDIKGVWDGFDCVEWAIGTVVVDGITFANCVCRFTLSTQVWTIYDYVGNEITAMIRFDDKTSFPHLMGTAEGKTGAMDTGYDDFGVPFYFEFIDRWRGYSDLYSEVKSMSGISVYHQNAGGANIMYQVQGAGTNEWSPLETIDDAPISLFPNIDTIDFNAARFRIAGTTRGVPIVIHGIEILSITNKGFDQN